MDHSYAEVMARYLDEAAAAADGIVITHEPELQRFAVYLEGETGRTRVGEAHYSFLDENTVDFDHTLVIPEFRGTGLSGLLAHRAVTSEVVQGRAVRASCWFIDGYIKQHPELLAQP